MQFVHVNLLYSQNQGNFEINQSVDKLQALSHLMSPISLTISHKLL
jgi:hypothetical protein